MIDPTRILVTGGAGFIGSALIRHIVGDLGRSVVNVDCLTYAANLENLAGVADDPRYAFERVDICDGAALARVFAGHGPDAVVHLAAESHVDRSIDGPDAFIRTNVLGTGVLLSVARSYWQGLPPDRARSFRFHHVSTDEVYGSLGATGLFTEETPYDPRSPYSASKAASDHLVSAWGHTYGLPTVRSNCSNNYGPYQLPEKLIPLTILNALERRALPVYGDGMNVRDWLHVDDHARALWAVLTRGRIGETYNIGGDAEMTNIAVVQRICDLLDRYGPGERSRRELITFVADRPGHDRRYAIDAGKARRDLGWAPRESFDTGLDATVRWYLDNPWWWQKLRDHAARRLGKGG